MDKLKMANNNQENELDQLKKANDEKKETIQQIAQELETIKRSDGTVYIRWGRTVCPNRGTELVYKGYAAGSHYTHTGGAANYICLPDSPTWGVYHDSINSGGAFVFGAEYQTMTADLLSNIQDYNVPCVVCKSNSPISIMIPGRNICTDSSWTLEYAGYLAAGHYNHQAAPEYVCLDGDSTALNNTNPNENGVLFNVVEGRCGSLPCGPYVDGRELTCAVCTK